MKVLLTAAVLMIGVITSACNTAPAPTEYEQAVAREEAIAANDVWHAAKLRGVAYRAIGQEPGWLLEMYTGDRIELSLDYGSDQRNYEYVEPRENETERSSFFELSNEDSILIQGTPCSDSMNGEQFETTVTLMLDERELKGCGRALY